MTKLITATAIIGVCLGAASAQVNSGVVGSPPKDLFARGTPSVTRERVVSRNDQANHARTAVPNNTPGPNATATKSTPAKTRVPSVALSQKYLVGVGDVLDVQLADLPTKKSTLFTVREGGVLDYPLAGDSLAVAGLTTDEIAVQLRARIKVFENPSVLVKVRDYASHNVIITGLVADPGAKFLRREAIPLYVALMEAQPRPEAITATIARSGQPAINVDLNDQKAMSLLVMAGDVIKIAGRPSEAAGFFYTGGALNLPGQKAFHAGLTLTQAILASGGVTRDADNKARIARQGADGRLSTTEYNLRQIEDGKIADPVLRSGDRITIAERR